MDFILGSTSGTLTTPNPFISQYLLQSWKSVQDITTRGKVEVHVNLGGCFRETSFDMTVRLLDNSAQFDATMLISSPGTMLISPPAPKSLTMNDEVDSILTINFLHNIEPTIISHRTKSVRQKTVCGNVSMLQCFVRCGNPMGCTARARLSN